MRGSSDAAAYQLFRYGRTVSPMSAIIARANAANVRAPFSIWYTARVMPACSSSGSRPELSWFSFRRSPSRAFSAASSVTSVFAVGLILGFSVGAVGSGVGSAF